MSKGYFGEHWFKHHKKGKYTFEDKRKSICRKTNGYKDNLQ